MDRVSALLQRLVEIIQPLAERLGGPGLTIVAFFDSSFLSLPEVSDALTVLLTARNPSFWWYYAMMTTLGSVAGCYALYSLGRKGGEAFLRRRMRERHVEWGMALFKRHGMLAIIVPSLLPPPMPFKLFVLIAGIVDVRPLTFVAAVVLGRGFRYGIEAWLAYRYGAQALTFIRENLPAVSIGVAVGLTVFALAIMIWQRRTPQNSP
jgi:membrane protein YqaA with SNARE-associated domain